MGKRSEPQINFAKLLHKYRIPCEPQAERLADADMQPDQCKQSQLVVADAVTSVETSKENTQQSLFQVFGVTIGDIVEPCPTVSGKCLVSEVQSHFSVNNVQGVVVLEGNKPVGLLMKTKMYYHLGSHYGVSLYYKRPVERVMDRQPLIVNGDLPLEAVSQMAMARPEASIYDLIIVVKDDTYIGAVSIINLLKNLTSLQLRSAANSNPLTGLPGNLLIEQQLKKLIEEKAVFAVLYVDLDNFKAFNDKYGFEHGDKVLLMTATLLNSCIAEYGSATDKDFLGHLGGDDFVIITILEKMEELCLAIVEKFDGSIRKYYSEEDCKRGCIDVVNRKGKEESFPIMTISIGVVHNRLRIFENYLEIGEVAAELKRKAKKIDGSAWVIDQRHD